MFIIIINGFLYYDDNYYGMTKFYITSLDIQKNLEYVTLRYFKI